MSDRNRDQNNHAEDRVRASLKKKLRKKRIKRIVTWIVVLALVLVGVYSYQFYKANGRLPFANAERLAQAAEAAAALQEIPVREIEFTQTIDISGNVEAFQTQMVMFRSTGAVTGVFVEEGDAVEKGELLATIDDTSQ